MSRPASLGKYCLPRHKQLSLTLHSMGKKHLSLQKQIALNENNKEVDMWMDHKDTPWNGLGVDKGKTEQKAKGEGSSSERKLVRKAQRLTRL